MLDRFFAILTLALLGALHAQAQLPRPLIRENYDPKTGKTELRVTPLLDQLPPSGYLPVRVYIFNDTKIPRTWQINFTSNDSGYVGDGNELKSDFSITCEAKRDTEIDLLVPLVSAFQQGYSTTTTLLVNVRAPTPLRSSSNSLSTDYNEDFPAVMVSEKLYIPNGTALSSAADSALMGSSHHSYGGGPGIEFGAVFNPKQMSEDWRAYSGFDACLLTEDDWSAFSPGTRTAFLKWIRLGGSLIIYTPNSASDLATLNIDATARGKRRAELSWGAVLVISLPPDGKIDPNDAVRLVKHDLVRKTGANRLYTLRNDFRPSWPLQIAFGSETANILFFILVLIAFGILVGPVNLFVFARAGQRHRLFITTPIISLGASLLLVILILFQDGFGGRGQRVVLMEIGPDNTAYLSQEQIARTGVLLKTGFTTQEHGYLSPVMLDDSRWARVTQTNRGGNGRYTVDFLETGLKLAGDWFQSRSEHGHLFETARPTRGRIDLIQPGVISSTFDFPLESLFYLDPSGQLWTAENVVQGRNTKLIPATDVQLANWLALERRRFSPRNQLRLDLTKARPGHFLAAASKAPAVDTLPGIRWTDTHTLITGQVSSQ